MKTIALLLAGILPALTYSQFAEDFLIHYRQDLNYSHDQPIIEYGVSFEYFVDDVVSLNYSFGYAKYNDDMHHIHAAAGPTLGIPLLGIGLISSIGCAAAADGYWEEEWNTSTGQYDSVWIDTTDPDKAANCGKGALMLISGLVLTCIPEGVNFHIPIIEDHVRFAPYVNLAGVDFVRDDVADETNLRWSYGAGGKLVFHDDVNFLNVSGYAGFKRNRDMGFRGHYGVQLGFRVN